MAKTKAKKMEASKNKLIDMQDVLFETLGRLNNDEAIKENPDVEIKRCNAIAKVSSTIINSVKTNINIMQLADKHETTTNELNEFLGL